ncbi:heme ABC exporter ATP-binding protein CcmA [Elioraea rosea]|uniref:heme ABC exporter ATP-binding protein CcmA n=1 Tax=Elioraea rosea TaxID=2492390 RepID=UPI001182D902|nr:heme ABC exporter ATP-binding protein CcmA [Elioraea rosea]
MLQAEDLAAARGGRSIFAGVSFTLTSGMALTLTGPNGAGKTTLLRLLAGLGRIVGGRLLWNGADALADRAAHARRLTLVGHQDAIKTAFTVEEALAHEARIAGVDPAHAGAAMVALGLSHLGSAPIRILSAGQRRRVALARLPLARRTLWLLDEPTVALDHAGVAALGAVMAAHRAAGGIIIASSHLPLPLPNAAQLRFNVRPPETEAA